MTDEQRESFIELIEQGSNEGVGIWRRAEGSDDIVAVVRGARYIIRPRGGIIPL